MNELPKFALAAAAAVLSLPTAAASLHLAPVSLSMTADQMAVGLTLSNPSDKPLVAQVRLFAWSQDLNDDHLSAQQDLVLSPPITNIAPQGEQVVRVVRLKNVHLDKEQTYRLIVDELPDPSANATNGAVDIRIRYSVPLFIVPSNASANTTLSWQLSHHDSGWFLRVVNMGVGHAQLSAVKLVRPDGKSLTMAEGLLGYALGNGTREWAVPSQFNESWVPGLHVEAFVNGQAAQATLPVSAN